MAKSRIQTYRLIADPRTIEDRFRLASECTAALRRYRDNFHELERRPQIDARMTERAYEAERNLRILLKTSLDSINEIWDSGEARSMLRLSSKTGTDLGRELSAGLPAAKRFLAERYPGLDISPLDEISPLLERYKIQSTSGRNDEFTVEFQDGNGQPQKQTFHVEPAAGDGGRVSSEAFFSPGYGPSFGRVSLYDQGNCHSASWSSALAAPSSQAVYGALVGSMGVAREMMYTHAREVEEYGPAYVRGAGPVAVVVGIIIAAIAIYGIATGLTIVILCMDPGNNIDSGVCTAGNWILGISTLAFFLGAALAGVPITFGNTDPQNWTDPEMGSGSLDFPINNPSTS